jgi:16S rRNA (cytosine1402-N4)-methyltransferase
MMFNKKDNHIPVLLPEVLALLQPEDNKTYIDATFGAGGYSKAILEQANCNLYAFDRDPDVAEYAADLQSKYSDRFKFFNKPFSNIKETLEKFKLGKVNGVVFDLGVSSMQLDEAERGFSFMQEGELDMRMEKTGISAKDVVNSLSETDLADVIYRYGDEKRSRKIAKYIVAAREKEVIGTTMELAQIIKSAVGSGKKQKIDPSTKTFQAIRIYVNQELLELEKALRQVDEITCPDSKIIFVTFHSLEDKLVKDSFAKKSGASKHTSKYLPPLQQSEDVTLKFGEKKFIAVSDSEISRNPRSRSAKIRYAIKS